MIRRSLDRLYTVLGALAACFLAMIALSVAAQMLGRYLGLTIDATEFSGFCMAASSFLGLAYAMRHGAHVRVDMLLDILPAAVRRLFEIFACTVSVLFIGYAAWCAALFTLDSHEFGELSPGLLAAPMWIPQAGMTIGLAFLALALLDDLIVLLSGGTPSYATKNHGSLE